MQKISSRKYKVGIFKCDELQDFELCNSCLNGHLYPTCDCTVTFSCLIAAKRCIFSRLDFYQDPTEPSNFLPQDRQTDRKFGISAGYPFFFLTNTHKKHNVAFLSFVFLWGILATLFPWRSVHKPIYVCVLSTVASKSSFPGFYVRWITRRE